MRMIAIALLGAGLTAGALPARAQEEGVFMKNLLGSVGIIPKDKDPIIYRERAPLVLPPKIELREPVATSAGVRDGQWPNDPDVAARRRRSADSRVPVTESETARLDKRPELSQAELAKGRVAGAGLYEGPARHTSTNRDNPWIHPDILKTQGRRVDDNVFIPGEEPARTSLHQPPSGYRASATGKAVQRDFEVPDRSDPANPLTYIKQQNRR